MMDAGEELNFIGRVKSFIGYIIYKKTWRSLVWFDWEHYRKNNL